MSFTLTARADVRLGKGTFAEVKKAVDVETGDLRAIKVSQVAITCDRGHRTPADVQQIVKHRFGNNPKTLELFQREIDICQQLTHVSPGNACSR